jgi:hypothetical protein
MVDISRSVPRIGSLEDDGLDTGTEDEDEKNLEKNPGGAVAGAEGTD